jgi:hypothetical protein
MSLVESKLDSITAHTRHHIAAGDYFLGEIKAGQTFRIV